MFDYQLLIYHILQNYVFFTQNYNTENMVISEACFCNILVHCQDSHFTSINKRLAKRPFNLKNNITARQELFWI